MGRTLIHILQTSSTPHVKDELSYGIISTDCADFPRFGDFLLFSDLKTTESTEDTEKIDNALRSLSTLWLILPEEIKKFLICAN